MKKTGIVFGGQGSQYEHMGRQFLEHPKTKHLYDEIGDYHDIMKDGTMEELS